MPERRHLLGAQKEGPTISTGGFPTHETAARKRCEAGGHRGESLPGRRGVVAGGNALQRDFKNRMPSELVVGGFDIPFTLVVAVRRRRQLLVRVIKSAPGCEPGKQ